MPEEVHVRTRVDLPQRAVEVERISTEVQLEPLSQDYLEDVAVEDVLPRHLDRLGVELRRGAPAKLGQLVVALGWGQQGLVERPGPIGGQLVESSDRRVIEGVA